MTTLNARANQAWIDARDTDTGFSPFSHQRHAFEEGWETGYKTRSTEIADRLEDMAGGVAAGELRDLLHVFAQEVRGGAVADGRSVAGQVLRDAAEAFGARSEYDDQVTKRDVKTWLYERADGLEVSS